MASALAWTVLLCAATLTAAFQKSGRIVGGESTTIEELPYILQVEFLSTWSGSWSQSCGGNIITSRWFLSASHCFEGIFYDPSSRRVRAGTTLRNVGGLISNVEASFNHPTYGSLQYDGDVSAIKLVTPLVFNAVIQAVSIPSQGTIIPENLPVVHAGWGTLWSGGSTPPDLQKVTLYTISKEVCSQRYGERGYVITDNMICAGVLDVGGKDACQGDSGGPLYYGDVLIGVVSWGIGCADSYFPGVSAAIAPYSDWIVETVNNN